MRRLAVLLAIASLVVTTVPAGAHHKPWHQKPGTPAPPPPPPPSLDRPTGFAATIAATTVDLRWNPIDDDATRVRLYRDGRLVADLPRSARSWDDAAVAHGATYEYRLHAVYVRGTSVVTSAPAVDRVTLPLYKVGAAAFDISPDLIGLREINLGGDGIGHEDHTVGGMLDPGDRGRTTTERIKARAVVFDDGKQSIALATIETQGYFAAYRDQLRGLADMAAASARPGLPAKNILIASDHTHSGPDTVGAWGGMPRAYFDLVYQRTVAAITTAYAQRRFANVVAGHSDAYDLIYNQSCPEALYQGEQSIPQQVMDLPCPTGSLQGTKGKDGKDGMLRAVQARTPYGQTVVTFAAYAAHATTGLADGVHGDWPQVLGDAMAARYGGVGIAMQGAVGKTQPCRPHCAFTKASNPSNALQGRRAQITANYLAHVVAALGAAKPVTGPVAAAQARIREVVTSPAVLGLLAAGGTAFGARLLRSIAPPWQNGNTVATVVSALRVGDVLFAGAPGEAYPEIAFGIRDALKGPREIVTLSLANDQLGYLIAPAADYPLITAQVAVNDNTIFNVSPTIGDHVMCADIRLAKSIGFATGDSRFAAYCAPYDLADAAGDPVGAVPMGGVSLDEL
jgi:hypothetical protein